MNLRCLFSKLNITGRVSLWQKILESNPALLGSLVSYVVKKKIYTYIYSLCRQGTGYFDNLGFASLTVWNMRTWKAMVCNCLSHKVVCESRIPNAHS